MAIADITFSMQLCLCYQIRHCGFSYLMRTNRLLDKQSSQDVYKNERDIFRGAFLVVI